MTLLVDIGNSRMKWALLDQSGYRCLGECRHEGALDPAFWGQFPCEDKFEKIVIASVLGAENEALIARGLQLNLEITPQFIHSAASGYGVVNGYAAPQKLGVDRWLALIGARSLTDKAVCIVDCGTAVTVDLMDANGVHCGGLIAPGLQMMETALRKGAQQLRSVPKGEIKAFADNTADAISSGCFWSMIGMIERVYAKFAANYSQPPTVFLAGGDATALEPYLSFSLTKVTDIVLQGLAVIAKEAS